MDGEPARYDSGANAPGPVTGRGHRSAAILRWPGPTSLTRAHRRERPAPGRAGARAARRAPLRVLLLGAVPPPYGGVQVNLMAIRAHLARRGDRPFAINLTGHRQDARDGLFFPRTALGVFWLILRLRPHVLHLHIGGHLPWRLVALGLLCTLWPGARAVLTFHSGGFPSSEEGRRLTPRGLKARVLRRFDRLIAVNEEIRAFFLKCGAAPDRVRVVSPYANGSPHEGPLPGRLEGFLRTHTPLLVTIGLLEPEYDLPLQMDVMRDLLADHPRAGLVIVGSGSLEASLRDRLRRTPWRDHVLLYGDLDHDMALAVLGRASVFLRTTRYDGDALSVREALALGIPVVATRTALRPAGVRLVEIGDRRGVAAAIRASLAEREAAPLAGPFEPQPDDRPGAPDNIADIARLYEEACGRPSFEERP
jgi:glycosyltransferase involved in cell wall biosynthesis